MFHEIQWKHSSRHLLTTVLFHVIHHCLSMASPSTNHQPKMAYPIGISAVNFATVYGPQHTIICTPWTR